MKKGSKITMYQHRFIDPIKTYSIQCKIYFTSKF